MAEDLVPYAYEYGKSNGDGTYSVVIERPPLRSRVADRATKPLYTADLIEQQAASLAAKDKEIERLRRYLHPYADDTEISGMSWSGFHLIGNKKSISELHRIENRSSQLDVFRAAFDERVKAAESRAEQAERALAETRAHLAMRNSDHDETRRALAEAVEVMRAFVRNEVDGALMMTRSHVQEAVAAARAFVAQHGSDSREGK